MQNYLNFCKDIYFVMHRYFRFVFCSAFLVAATLPTHKHLIMECYNKKTIAMVLDNHTLFCYLNNPDAFEW